MKTLTENVDVPFARGDLVTGLRVVCIDGKARRIVWIRQYDSVTMYRFDGIASVHRLEGAEAVNVRTVV
jgi:hypothetical protein